MTSIETYIQRRLEAKRTYYPDLASPIAFNTTTDTALSLINEYLTAIDVNTADNYQKLNDIASLELSCKAGSTLQPIFGFKELRVPTGVGTGNWDKARPGIEALSSIYQATIQSIETSYHLSDVYDTNSWKQVFKTLGTQFVEQRSLSGGILNVNDIIAILNELMDILSNVYNHKINVYFKRTEYNGRIYVYTCECPLQDLDAWLRSSQDSNAYIGKPYSWRLYVSPYAKQNNVNPLSGIDAGVELSGSNSLLQIMNQSYSADNEQDHKLVYCDTFVSDNQTYNVNQNDGSNGIATAFKVVNRSQLVLRQLIDVESLFDLKPGKVIKAERIIAAITYIFEMWQKNIATLHEDMYTCHYNCHANSVGFSDEPEDPRGQLSALIDINDKMVSIPTDILKYELRENQTEYYRSEDRIEVLEIYYPKILEYRYTYSGTPKLKTTWDFYQNTQIGHKGSFSYPLNNLEAIPESFTLSVLSGETPPSSGAGSLNGHYGPLRVTFEIDPDYPSQRIEITAIWYIEPIPAQLYTGEQIKPTPVVRNIDGDIVNSLYYTCTYSNNTRIGPKAKIKVTADTGAQQYYKGSLTANFQIQNELIPIDGDQSIMTGIDSSYILGASENKPVPTLTLAAAPYTELQTPDDFILQYSNTNTCGNASLSALATNIIYMGEKHTSYVQKYNLADATIDAIPDQAYTGYAIEPTLRVTYYSRVLVKGSDYVVTFLSNTDPGTATATIKPYNTNYQINSKSATFKILGNIADITWSSVGNQSYTGSAITPQPTLYFHTKTLTENTHYTLSYSNNVGPGTAMIIVTGKGSYTGSKNIPFEIVQPSLSYATISNIEPQNYTGYAITPLPIVKYYGTMLTNGTHYSLSYSNNINVGTATVTATGIGTYTGSKSTTFSIYKTPTKMVFCGNYPTYSETSTEIGTVTSYTASTRTATVQCNGADELGGYAGTITINFNSKTVSAGSAGSWESNGMFTLNWWSFGTGKDIYVKLTS